MVRGADEPLLLGAPPGKHDRRFEIDAALTEHPRQLHRQRGAAAIVVDARCGAVVRQTAAGLMPLALGAPADRRRIVVAADIDAARAFAGQNGDEIPDLDVARDSRKATSLA